MRWFKRLFCKCEETKKSNVLSLIERRVEDKVVSKMMNLNRDITIALDDVFKKHNINIGNNLRDVGDRSSILISYSKSLNSISYSITHSPTKSFYSNASIYQDNSDGIRNNLTKEYMDEILKKVNNVQKDKLPK